MDMFNPGCAEGSRSERDGRRMTAVALAIPSVLIASVVLVALLLRVRRARAGGASDTRPWCVGCWLPLGDMLAVRHFGWGTRRARVREWAVEASGS
jgi:hypothetical protein